VKSTFGLAHLKEEGAPAHPEDIYIHCGCKKCEKNWQKQLKAYNEHQKKKALKQSTNATGGA